MRALCWHLLMGLVQQKLKKLEKVSLAAVGIEPPNSWLQTQCSTNEPPRLTCLDVLIAHIYLTWRIEMLRLLLIFPQQLSKTCPLAKKILSLRQKYEKKEMILVIFLLCSEIAFFLDSWKSNLFWELFFNMRVKFLITRKLVIKNFTRMFKKSSQKKFDFHSSRKKAISLRRKKCLLSFPFFLIFAQGKYYFESFFWTFEWNFL